ncbi:EcsC family protein [Cytobacillus dafuensis]|uniref:EcsC family protein n=1 Tax=Cytobacillus dafuensis TaxID=1742359 RepID=A0A5B8Z571_CYTDA|nr:EcsC family protein [Cytobacillus dafuensis]QED48264.1 EcsC family protein [Cytobacillus dafuensis]
MIETKEQLFHELKICEKWEKEQSDLWFWEKLGRLPFKLLDKFTPAFLQKKIGVIIDELGQYVQSGGRYLSSVSSLKAYYPKMDVTTLEDVKSLPISTMDDAVAKLTGNRKKLATIQGAGTGFGGFLTISIDIPMLLGIQLKTLQDIAICYGYNPDDTKERLYIVKILQFVSSDIVGKKAILQQLSIIDSPSEGPNREVISEIQGWREVVFTYRDQIGWKKLFQMIPIAGLLFGAVINRSAVTDISEAGKMLYRKRKINERLSLENEKERSCNADE